MFARHVSMNLKPNTQAQFTAAIEKDVLPVLRAQRGFKDEITFFIPGANKAVALSLWDEREQAEAYNGTGYPQVLKTLAGVVEGTPQVTGYEVSNSTFHKIAANVPA
jgi:hypothetical protein